MKEPLGKGKEIREAPVEIFQEIITFGKRLFTAAPCSDL